MKLPQLEINRPEYTFLHEFLEQQCEIHVSNGTLTVEQCETSHLRSVFNLCALIAIVQGQEPRVDHMLTLILGKTNGDFKYAEACLTLLAASDMVWKDEDDVLYYIGPEEWCFTDTLVLLKDANAERSNPTQTITE